MPDRPLRAMVMAAGRGTRLWPLTDVVAKPALPVGNEPVMGHILRGLARRGIRTVAANCSYLAGQMQGIYGDGSAWGVDLSWSVEESPQGTAGGVKHAEQLLRDGDTPVLVLSGDGLHDVDPAPLVAAHEESDALVTLALIEVADPSEYGVVVLDDDGLVTRFQEKPAPGTELSRLSNTGIYVISPEVFDLIPGEGGYDFGTQGFPEWLAGGRRLRGVVIDDYWNDIGGPEAYLAGNLACVDGSFATLAEDSEWGDQVLISPTASIGAGVELRGPCVIGPGAAVGDGARIVGSVVLPGAAVSPGAVVAHGIVGEVSALAGWAASLGG